MNWNNKVHFTKKYNLQQDYKPLTQGAIKTLMVHVQLLYKVMQNRIRNQITGALKQSVFNQVVKAFQSDQTIAVEKPSAVTEWANFSVKALLCMFVIICVLTRVYLSII